MSRTKKSAVLKRKMISKTRILTKGPGDSKSSQVPKTPKTPKTPQLPGVHVGSVIKFGALSKAKYNKLGNLSKCIITGNIWVLDESNEYVTREYTFPSSEHFWCAHFFERDCDVNRLAVGGDLSTLETGLGYFVSPGKLDAKIKYWSIRDNVGIVASRLNRYDDDSYCKKSTLRNLRKASELGMRMSIYPCEKYGPQGTDETMWNIWSNILMSKMSQNEEHRKVLLRTGCIPLVDCGSPAVNRVEDGKLYGRNYVGYCMMSVRDTLNAWLGGD